MDPLHHPHGCIICSACANPYCNQCCCAECDPKDLSHEQKEDLLRRLRGQLAWLLQRVAKLRPEVAPLLTYVQHFEAAGKEAPAPVADEEMK